MPNEHLEIFKNCRMSKSLLAIMFFRVPNENASVQHNIFISKGFGADPGKCASVGRFNALNSNPNRTSDDVTPLKIMYVHIINSREKKIERQRKAI